MFLLLSPLVTKWFDFLCQHSFAHSNNNPIKVKINVIANSVTNGSFCAVVISALIETWHKLCQYNKNKVLKSLHLRLIRTIFNTNLLFLLHKHLSALWTYCVDFRLNRAIHKTFANSKTGSLKSYLIIILSHTCWLKNKNTYKTIIPTW